MLRSAAVSLSLVAALAARATSAGAQADSTGVEYDVVVRNGRVLDGAGNPWVPADVAIAGGRVVRVGIVQGKGQREIDATGRYVSPGWIDMMDQSGAALLRSGLAENKLRMGVTTALAGEGGPPVPVDSLRWYFQTLERQGISVNFGTYVNEGDARVPVLGQSARAPTPEELGRMRAIIDTAMRAGALGMSTALIYPPLSYATTDELIEVAKGAAKHGGVYASHIRGEGREVLAAVREAIEIGEKAGMPVEIFHLKVAYKPGWGVLMPQVGRLVDSARARGVDVAADVYVYAAGGTGLEATIPSWAHEGGADSLKARLADPATRARLKREIRTGAPGWWNIVEAAGGWGGVVLANAGNPENARFEGKTLAQIATAWGKTPEDAAFDLVAAGGTRVMAIFHMMGERDIETALRFPWTSIGSDAGAAVQAGGPDLLGLPHPRSYGNFPRVIARYVRERRVLTLPEAIRKMTSWPAARMRITDRGLLRPGMWADVVVFDYDSIQDRATYEQPTRSPEGIDYVLVNGQVVIDRGRHTGAKPGRIIYGPGVDRSGPALALRLPDSARAGAGAAAAKRDYSAPLGAPYTAQDVTVPTPMGHTLAGTLTLPRGASRARPVPAVVTITGSGPQDRDEDLGVVLPGYRPFRQLADSLGRRGIAVLRMDDRGVGASTGDHKVATSADFAEDIRAGLAYLRTRPEIDAGRLALLGHSEGGLIGPLVAAKEPTLRALALLAGPAQGGRQILQYQIANGIRNDTTLSGARRDSALATIPGTIDSLAANEPWMKFFMAHDPLATARQVRTPVLILNGGTDRQVTAEQVPVLAAAFKAGGNRDVTTHVFPDLDHLFVYDPDGKPQGYAKLPRGAVEPQVIGMTVDWLVKRLR